MALQVVCFRAADNRDIPLHTLLWMHEIRLAPPYLSCSEAPFCPFCLVAAPLKLVFFTGGLLSRDAELSCGLNWRIPPSQRVPCGFFFPTNGSPTNPKAEHVHLEAWCPVCRNQLVSSLVLEHCLLVCNVLEHCFSTTAPALPCACSATPKMGVAAHKKGPQGIFGRFFGAAGSGLDPRRRRREGGEAEPHVRSAAPAVGEEANAGGS